jgi:hypothetical protein
MIVAVILFWEVTVLKNAVSSHCSYDITLTDWEKLLNESSQITRQEASLPLIPAPHSQHLICT